MPQVPFMEHPSGDFDSAVDAMADAIARLRGLPRWDTWITFFAQGCAGRPDTYSFQEIRMLGDDIQIDGGALDISRVCEATGVSPNSLIRTNSHYRLNALSPRDTARLFDFIFRFQYGLGPHADEDPDYAVGAEW